MTLRVHPAAADELRDAARWYDAEVHGMGELFVAEVEATFALIETSPFRFAAVPGMPGAAARRAVLKRFPYKIVYRVADSGPVVVAIAHARRRPFYWRGRT